MEIEDIIKIINSGHSVNARAIELEAYAVVGLFPVVRGFQLHPIVSQQ